MLIEFDSKNQLFHLQSGRSVSYAMAVTGDGGLEHLYMGGRITASDLEHLFNHALRSFAPYPADGTPLDSPTVCGHEFAAFNTGDFRLPSVVMQSAAGHRSGKMIYKSHQIYAGKKSLPGLPASCAECDEAETLEIVLADPVIQVEYILFYTVFRKLDAIARSVQIRNISESTVYLEKICSLTLDLPFAATDWELLSLPGTYALERRLSQTTLPCGITTLSSSRGFSSHDHNPAFALAEANCTESTGDVWGFMLLYSGNFAAEIQRSTLEGVRINLGINPINFRWQLAPGEKFTSPEAVMVFSENGLGSMSRTFHDLIRSHLLRKPWDKKARPLLLNSWEAFYFDINSEKLLNLARLAGECGMDLFVLDDGWFGERNSDESSLGDWQANEAKLRSPLHILAQDIKKYVGNFGLWFEPEMISPQSKLFAEHPEWVLQIAGRKSSLSRNQLVLDMTRTAVRDYLFDAICKILDQVPVNYIKWDCNRSLSEVGSLALLPEQQLETSHRFILGVYDLLERLLNRYPDLLIEGCAGGGGRFDGGMLAYTPQIWCSDNTDAEARLDIQYGTSLFYPPLVTGAHISCSPNHQTARNMPFAARAVTAFAGSGGFELDLTKSTSEEIAEITAECQFFRQYHHLVEQGDLYRLGAPGDYALGWMNMAKDGSEFLLSAVVPRVGAVYSDPVCCLRLSGLEPGSFYQESSGGKVYSGSFLMKHGFILPLAECDGSAWRWHFVKITNN